MKQMSVKFLTTIAALFFLLFLIYRYSEQYGDNSRQACLLAMLLAVVAGSFVIIPVLAIPKSSRKLFFCVIIGGFLRAIVTASGILWVFIEIPELRFWFLVWATGFYFLFLVLETGFSVYLIRNHQFHNEGSDFNDRVDLGKYESS